MAYKKRYLKNKKKGNKKMVVYRNPRQHLYQFKRHCQRGTIFVAASTSYTATDFTFKITELPNYADFTNLFDMYRITGVSISFIPITNVILSTGNSGSILFNASFSERFFSAFDCNDKNVKTNLTIREYQNCKATPFSRIHKRYIKPRPLVVSNETGTGSSYGIMTSTRNPWISNASVDTQYFGLKTVFEHPTSLSEGSYYTVECVYYLECKNVN